MKRNLVLCCATLAIAAGSLPLAGWSQPVAEDAKHWLERMLQSTQTLSYEGTFIYVQGPHIEAMRIVNGGGAEGKQRRRLFSLSGPPREVVVANNSVICLLPKQHATFVGGDYPRSPFPLSIPRELGRLQNHYQFEMLGSDRVAGLEAQVIAIKPRDAWRFGYRLSLDRRNGMVLRSALLDEKGYPIEQLMFTDLQLRPHIDDADFVSAALPDGAAAQGGPNPDNAESSAGEPVTRSAWRVDQLPEGFAKVSHNRITQASGRQPTEHLVFADGLATISIFVEKLNQAPPLLQGRSQFGSMNAFGVVVNDHQILVVGEAPAATMQRIATSIRFDSEADKP
jgi:sigma-E factor negative regulatory protein RseB